MRVLWLHRQSSMVGEYRCRVPARYLREQGWDITCPDKPYPTLKPTPQAWLEQQLGKGYDLLVVDRAVNMTDLPTLSGFRHVAAGCRMIVDTDDDWTNVPGWNTARDLYRPGHTVYKTGKAHYKLSELLTVSTEPLAEAMRSRAHEVAVCPNGIDPRDWEVWPTNPDRGSDPHLRVLYGGASGHYGDLDEARAGLELVLENPPVPFRLICFGAVPQWIHEMAKRFPDRIVRLPWVNFKDYPAAVAWGGFDAAIAPLADHPFNRCKSNIKWLEAAVQGIPFLCSDVGPYSTIPAGGAVKVANTPIQWSESLRALLTDSALRDKLRAQAYEAVHDNWTIEKIAPAWAQAFETALTRPRIETLEDTRLADET